MDFICSYFLFGQMHLLFEYKHLTKNPAFVGFYWEGLTDLFSNPFLEDLEYLFMLKNENLVR